MSDYTEQQLQAYEALRKAADRIGWYGYLAELRRRKMTPAQGATGVREYDSKNKPYHRGVYTPTGEHCAVIEAMSDVLSGEMSPEEAMALLWQYDVMKQRLGK